MTKENAVNQKLLKSVHKSKGVILFSALLFFTLSVALTFFIPKKYTALGLVYPTKSNLMKEEVNNPTFGYNMQADRLIQLFQSQQMERMVVEKFDLATHFKIDTNEVSWTNQLHEKYLKSVSFKRTKYLSVEIETVIDDPFLATNMVNFMINYIDTIRRDVFLKNTIIWKEDLDQKIKKQDLVVNKILTSIFESDYKNAPNALAKNREVNINARQENATILQGDQIILDNMKGHYSIELENLINQYYLELSILNRMQTDNVVAEEKISSPFPKIYVINSAVVDEKKTSPSFLKNGIVGLVVGFVLSLSFVLGKVKWNDLLESLKE